jgi:hypothetical protein
MVRIDSVPEKSMEVFSGTLLIILKTLSTGFAAIFLRLDFSGDIV